MDKHTIKYAIEDKKELLKKIEAKEFDRLNALTFEELEKEVGDWFGEYCSITTTEEADEELEMLLEDYMRYRSDESEEELLKLL
jgi:hypothetical protein